MSGWSQSIVFDSELLEKLDFKTENVQKTPKNFKDPFPRSKTSGFLISDQNQDTINTSLEVIEESPTRECNNRTMAHQSIRERLRNATIARKQVLKRNKSDSFVAAAKNVEQKPPPPSLIENESISKYFQSQFDVPECVADHENTVEPKEENMVNLSKLMMDSFTLNLQGSENPQPVLSRTNYDDLFKDSFKIEIDVPRDSDKSLPFEFSEKLMDKAISDDTLITETEKQELINDIDSMSFIQQPVLDLENSLFVEREMENEKDFLKSVLISQEIEDEVFKAPEILSIKQVSSQLSKSLVVDCTKNLLLISNWNLPTAVVNEYRKKNVVEMFEWQCDCLKNPKVSKNFFCTLF